MTRLIGALATFALLLAACGGAATVRVVEGTVDAVNVSGEGIGIDGEGYLIGSGQIWRDIDGTWREGGIPECTPPLSSGARVELGLVDVPADHDAIGQPNHVVWLKCLSMPTEVDAEGDRGLDPYAHYCARVPDHPVCG